VLFQYVTCCNEVPFECLFAAPEPPQTSTLSDTHAARISHLRARHIACRGRPDRPRSVLPRDHARLAATRAAQRGAACDTDRGSDPRRQRAGRRLAVAHALDRFACLPHCRRVTVVLNRVRNGVRRAHRAPVAAGRAGRRRARAQYRRLSARHSIDGRARRDHCDHPAGEPQRRRHHAPCDPARRNRDCFGALLCCLCARGANRQTARCHRQYRRLAFCLAFCLRRSLCSTSSTACALRWQASFCHAAERSAATIR